MTTTSTDFDQELRNLLAADPEEDRACELKVLVHGTNQPCPNTAVYRVSLIKPCQHICDVLLCESCLARTVVFSGFMTWTCTIPPTCRESYRVVDAIVNVERIKP